MKFICLILLAVVCLDCFSDRVEAQKNAEFRLFENGFSYKKFVCAWDKIELINVKAESQLIGGAKINWLIRKADGQEIILTDVIENLESIVKIIDGKIKLKTVI